MDDCIITPLSLPKIIRAYEHPSLWEGPYNAVCKIRLDFSYMFCKVNVQKISTSSQEKNANGVYF